jgi:hypothetical protein
MTLSGIRIQSNEIFTVITQAKLGVGMRERLRLPLEGKLSAERTDEVECSNQSNY